MCVCMCVCVCVGVFKDDLAVCNCLIIIYRIHKSQIYLKEHVLT